MPRGDGTGPMGMGRMTGRRAGYCAGFGVPGHAYPAGAGCGFGRGRGYRRMFHATGLPGWMRLGSPTFAAANGEAVDERAVLSSQVEFLEKQLQMVKKRLSHLKEDKE